jgi:hypothetical protein
MGFTPEPTTIKLNFKDDLEGLQVTMRSMSVAEYNAMLTDMMATGEEFLKANQAIYDQFSERLVSWNLDDGHGVPVPATREGLDTQDTNLVSRMIAAWQGALTAVPTKRKPQSENGSLPNRMEESTLGLDSMSQSPGN